MPNYIAEEFNGGLCVLTLNRPERRNPISIELSRELLQRVEAAAGNNNVRALLLRGAGAAFSVGGDIGDMANAGKDSRDLKDRIAELRALMEVVRLLHEMGKPTVAALHGAVAGGALALALACDLRIASQSVKMTTAFVKVALPGDYGCSYFLTRLVGVARARELSLLSPLLTGEQAHACGLVTRVVPDEELPKAAYDLAFALAQGPTWTFGAIKENLNLAESAGLAACLDVEARRQIEAMQTRDHQEAAVAFLQKRTPEFRGC